jgi:4,5-DOPA dioxygenase extradiol
MRMPVLFVGHGSPMNAIEENPFTLILRLLGKTAPKPEAICVVSAHGVTPGS